MSEMVPDGWEEKELSSMTNPASEKTEFNNQYEALTSSRSGLFKQSEYFNKRVTSSDNSGYRIIAPGQFTFRAMSDDGTFKFNRSSYSFKGIVSPAYEVFEAKNCSPDFLDYILNSDEFHQQIYAKAQGGTRLALKYASLSKFKIPIPPLPEQKKIASILTSVDEVIEKTQSQIDKLQDLKKGTMNELLTKGIGHTEFKDSELGRIPKSWEVKCIDDVIKFTGGAQPPRSSFIFEPKEGYVRLLQIRDYKSDRYETYIPEDLSRRNCNEDDVLIGRYGPPIFQILRGKSGSYNVALIKSEPRNDSLLKGYMYHFLTRSDLFHMIDSLSQRTSGQTGIDLDALKSFGFPLPPLNEQHKILEMLDHMDSSIKFFSSKLHQIQSLKKSLMQDLLTGKVRVSVN